jgi:hypothetical protein
MEKKCINRINELSQEVEDLKEQRKKEHENTDPNPHAFTATEQYLKGLSDELNEKFTFILGAAHKAARLPKRSMQKNKKKVGRKGEQESEPEEDNFPTNPQPIDFFDILSGLNFKMENHRKRLKYVEDLDDATAADIVKVVKAL